MPAPPCHAKSAWLLPLAHLVPMWHLGLTSHYAPCPTTFLDSSVQAEALPQILDLSWIFNDMFGYLIKHCPRHPRPSYKKGWLGVNLQHSFSRVACTSSWVCTIPLSESFLLHLSMSPSWILLQVQARAWTNFWRELGEGLCPPYSGLHLKRIILSFI